MKCTFYEATGNPHCKFHIIKFTPYWALNVDEDYRVSKRIKPKNTGKRIKTARRVCGQSR